MMNSWRLVSTHNKLLLGSPTSLTNDKNSHRKPRRCTQWIYHPMNVSNENMDGMGGMLYLFNDGRSNRARIVNHVPAFTNSFCRCSCVDVSTGLPGDDGNFDGSEGVSFVAQYILGRCYTAQRWTSRHAWSVFHERECKKQSSTAERSVRTTGLLSGPC